MDNDNFEAIKQKYTELKMVTIPKYPDIHLLWFKVGDKSFDICAADKLEHIELMQDRFAEALTDMVNELKGTQ